MRVDDTQLTWTGRGGVTGVVNNPGGKGAIERRDGDWNCRSCGKLVFATKDRVSFGGFGCGSKSFWGRCTTHFRVVWRYLSRNPVTAFEVISNFALGPGSHFSLLP